MSYKSFSVCSTNTEWTFMFSIRSSCDLPPNSWGHASVCLVLFLTCKYSRFTDLQQTAPSPFSQCPTCYNPVITEDSQWMNSWLAVTDAGVYIVFLICVWTLLPEWRRVVSLLFMPKLWILCGHWLPAQQTDCLMSVRGLDTRVLKVIAPLHWQSCIVKCVCVYPAHPKALCTGPL